MLFKKGSHPMPKSYNNHAHRFWEAIVEICNETKIEYLTFRAKVPSQQDDDYKRSNSKNEDMERVLQERLIKI